MCRIWPPDLVVEAQATKYKDGGVQQHEQRKMGLISIMIVRNFANKTDI